MLENQIYRTTKISTASAAVQGANYRAKASGKKAEGEVAVVLGAGNQTPVACMDILHKLFFDDAVVICKMNPVNEYLGKYIRCHANAIHFLATFKSL